MTRLPLLVAISILFGCGLATAQVPVSASCPSVVLGQILIQIMPLAFPGTLTPGVQANNGISIVNDDGGSGRPQAAPGTYPQSLACSFTVGSVTQAFNFPISIVLTGTGVAQTYTLSTTGVSTTFNLGAQGTLAYTQSPTTFPPFAVGTSFSGPLNAVTLLLQVPSIPAPTPLPPSIILTLTGLAGAGLYTAKQRLARAR